MKKFKLSAVISIVITFQILFLQSLYAQSQYPIEIKHQPVQVNLSNLKIKSVVENNQESQLLTGRIKRRAYNSHVLPGHIDYVVLGRNDEILYEGAIQVSGLNLRSRSPFGRQFKILLPELADGSHIKIGWHSTQHSTQASAVNNVLTYHKQNSLLSFY